MFLFWSSTVLGDTTIEPTTHGGIVVVVVVLVVVVVVDVVLVVELVGAATMLTMRLAAAEVAPSGSVTVYCKVVVPAPVAVSVTLIPVTETDQPPGAPVTIPVNAPFSASCPSRVKLSAEPLLTSTDVVFAVGGWLGATVVVVVVLVVV